MYIELDNAVHEMCCVFPRCGEKLVYGRLHTNGIYVQRENLCAELIRHLFILESERSFIEGDNYEVDSPNALWHLDGCHKLIRWRIVIHGGIDGYSRLITFLQASPNNKAESVLSAFLNEFGLPSRVRTDKGGENISLLPITCLVIQKEDQIGVALLLAKVHITRGFGVIYLQGALKILAFW